MKLKFFLSFSFVVLMFSSCEFGQGMLMGLSSLGTPTSGGYVPTTMPIATSSAFSSGGYTGGASSGSSGSSSSTSSRMCRVCVGSGKCRTCNGKGWYYDTGMGLGTKRNCPNCSDGKCTSCGGSGKK